MAKGEAHIANAASINILEFNGEFSAMIEKSVEDMNGLARMRFMETI